MQSKVGFGTNEVSQAGLLGHEEFGVNNGDTNGTEPASVFHADSGHEHRRSARAEGEGSLRPPTQTPRKQARQREGESERKREGEREPFVTCCRRVENAEGACESQSLASSRFRAAGLSCAGSY